MEIMMKSNILALLLLVGCATSIEKPVLNESSSIFSSKLDKKWVREVVDCSNKVVKDSGFLGELIAVEKFDYSVDSGAIVANKLLSHKYVITLYKSLNPWSKARAYAINGKEELNFNTRKNHSDVFRSTGTAIHEATHTFGYTHGDNSSKGKEKSIPYKVGDIAHKWAKKICNI